MAIATYSRQITHRVAGHRGIQNRLHTMAFISYAQTLEDVMLYRALREVTQGFYIDVGAHDPILHLVTLAFYAEDGLEVHVHHVPHPG